MPDLPPASLSYRDAGVDIDAGDALVERIKPFARRTMRPEVLAGIGGFGGLVEIGKRFREPVLVAGTMPWLLVVAAGVWKAIREREPRRFNPAMFLTVWCAIVFLFFSGSSSKLASYVLPIFPALALLAGRYLPSASRALLAVQAAAAVIAGVATIWLSGKLIGFAARDLPAQHPSVTPQEMAHIQAGLPVAIGEARPPVPWGRIFGSKDTWGTALAYFGFGYAATIFSTWFFIYLKEGRGFDMKASAVLGMLPFIATTTCCLLGGAVSDGLVKRYSAYIGRSIFGAFTLGLAGLILIVGAHTQDAVVASLLLAAGAGAIYLGQAVYYAVAAGPQIWSVGIARDGSFVVDPRWELDVPAQAGPLPVSDIAFSQRGAMILAQRAPIAAAYDYSAFTKPAEPRVLRFALKDRNDPPSPGSWKLVPQEYAVGFAGGYRNTNGGVAFGYGYGQDARGDFRVQLDRLGDRVRRDIDRGELNAWQGRRLMAQIGDLRQLERRYRYSGGSLDGRERLDLQARLNRVRA